MPEVLRALGVILLLAFAVFALARPAFSAATMQGEDYLRRRNLWVALVATAFVAHNIWIYIVVAAYLLVRAAPRDGNRVALYFFLLFALPGFSARIPGLGIINYVFDIGYIRLLALTLLLPTFLELRRDAATPRFGSLGPDRLIGSYLVLQFGLMLVASTVTNTLRVGVFYAFIDVFLPYFVISRSLRSITSLREALAAFAIATLVLSAIAVFESTRHWLLYASLDEALGVESPWGAYLERGEGGLLRAQASAGHAIPLGYVIALGLVLFHAVHRALPSRWAWAAGMVLLLAGLIAPVSRGPWVGAAAMLLIFIIIGPAPAVRVAKLGLLGVIVAAGLLASPAGDSIIRVLPFVGEEDHTVTYRQQLVQVSLELMLDNPFFGAYDYIYSPAMQDLRQGQGIVDVVNTYVAIGLGSGLIGLGLFAGFFLVIALAVFRAMRRLTDRESETYLIGQALFTAIFGILLMIGTVSSVTIIPTVYWALAGVGVGYATLVGRIASEGESANEPVHQAGESVHSRSPYPVVVR